MDPPVSCPCQHDAVEPVVLLTGKIVATVCVGCLARLPASWGCPDCEYADVQTLGEAWPLRVLVVPCPPHRAELHAGRPVPAAPLATRGQIT